MDAIVFSKLKEPTFQLLDNSFPPVFFGEVKSDVLFSHAGNKNMTYGKMKLQLNSITWRFKDKDEVPLHVTCDMKFTKFTISGIKFSLLCNTGSYSDIVISNSYGLSQDEIIGLIEALIVFFKRFNTRKYQDAYEKQPSLIHPNPTTKIKQHKWGCDVKEVQICGTYRKYKSEKIIYIKPYTMCIYVSRKKKMSN